MDVINPQSIQIGVIEFSWEHGRIAPALLAIQQELTTVPYDSTAVVEHKGGGSHSFKFTSLPGLLDAVLPVVHKHGCFLVQGGGGDNTVQTTTCVMHAESGQWAQNTIPIATNGAAMAVGSGISFGRRYGVLPLFALSCEDDGGAAAQRSMEPKVEVGLTNDMLFALPDAFRTAFDILGWKTGKVRAQFAKFVDDTGSLDRVAALSFLNHEVDKLAAGGSR